MEVEHELEAFRLNALSQTNYIVEILTDLGVCAALRVLTLRVNKQSHTQGIPAHSLALEELQHVFNPCALLVVVGHIVVFITLKNGDIAANADIVLCGYGGAQQAEGPSDDC